MNTSHHPVKFLVARAVALGALDRTYCRLTGENRLEWVREQSNATRFTAFDAARIADHEPPLSPHRGPRVMVRWVELVGCVKK